jgi:hypothetical protein
MARGPSLFPTVRSEGGLLPPDLLEKIAAGDRELGGLEPADYQHDAGERLPEIVARDWQRVRSHWAAFKSDMDSLPDTERGTTETREAWLRPLLRVLGYHPEFRAGSVEVAGRGYRVEEYDGPVPLHLFSFRQDLNKPRLDSAQRVSPHAELQEFLNVREDSLYGIVSNGKLLRLLRDSHSLTRLTYLEFDLEGMLDGAVYSDFVLLWLTLHRSRLPAPGAPATDCWLERWRDKAESQGTRALGELRKGVEQALKELGTGLLAHPANERLRDELRAGRLTREAFYGQLLRLLYRLLSLLVAEERDLLFPSGTDEAARARYARWYSLARLRDVAPRHRDDTRHDDLWRGLRLLFDVLAGRREGLGLPALGGLFAPDLDEGLLISNAHLSRAILALSRVKLKAGWRRVNYRDIGAEELGGVYEGLLELQPDPVPDAANPHFDFVKSDQRKKSGSYYTPTSLVDELIASALEPVIADRLAGARTPEAREQALLGITVCDSATGSGHFLIAAAQRLGRELARIRAGDREPSPEMHRQALRDVIRHCMYGVDANPLAVELCRVSLWLEGHDAGRPLTFLDAHVKCGNSLVGAKPELIADGIPDGAYDPVGGDDRKLAATFKKVNRQEAAGQQSLWQAHPEAWRDLIHGLGQASRTIDGLPEDELPQVDAQRRQFQAYDGGEVERARAVPDAWTAAFFWPLTPDAPEPPTSNALRVPPGEPPLLSDAQRREVARLRKEVGFFHWPLEFPEVFDAGGFDCVLGNPPWERIKLQELEFFAERDPAIAAAPNKAARQRLIDQLPETNPGLEAAFRQALRTAEGQSKFARASRRFALTAVGDVNVYALFAEHDRELVNSRGRAGIIAPSGIATDNSTKDFFQDVTAKGSLAALFDFENRRGFFEDVDSRMKFSLLTFAGQRVALGQLAFFLLDTAQVRDERRRFELTPDDFALLNPNTRTCPIFRTAADAELTRGIYRRVPVLVDETTGANPWGLQFLRMLDMSNDSGLFRDEPGPTRVPLYEGKMVQAFDHRAADVEVHTSNLTRPGQPRTLSESDHLDPSRLAIPQHWIEGALLPAEVRGLSSLVAFKSITSTTNERTMIATFLPVVATGNSLIVVLPAATYGTKERTCLLANLNSLTLDYVVKQKVGGVNLNLFLVNQFAILPPSAYTEADLEFIVPRVLELTYTACDLQPFARDLGWDGEPFPWDPDRRALLRAELDAWYAALYGLTRDELRYILDPQDVHGPDFPGETFRVLKERETRQYGEYRTRRLVLHAWDRLDLAPRNRDGRYEVPAAPPAPATNRPRRKPATAAVAGADKLPSQAALFASPLEAAAIEDV